MRVREIDRAALWAGESFPEPLCEALDRLADAVDMLEATGMPRNDALAALPAFGRRTETS